MMIIGEERRAIQGDRNEATTCNNMPIQQSVTEGKVNGPGLILAQNDDGPLKNGPLAHIPFKYMEISKF